MPHLPSQHLTAVTIPTTWKPTRDQVRAAAMAFARVTGAEWLMLPAASREDFLIDGHAALMAAHVVGPIPGAAGTDVVCMTREHADLYSELFAVSESHEEFITKRQGMTFEDVQRIIVKRTDILARLRALASPERTTP